MDVNINDLSFGYENNSILKNIKLNFYKGKFYSIIGPNGSGKTTLLRLIATLLDTPDNTIFINNIDITSLKSKEKASFISLVPQMFNIDYEFTVEDIISMGRYPYLDRFGKLTNEDKEIIDNTLEKTNLTKYRKRLANNLSGGELQRVILARAIVQETQIMLLDEPVSHLDIHHQLDILNLVKDLVREKDKTVICVLHDLNLALKYSDDVIMLKDGKVRAIGNCYDVLTENNIKEVYGIDVKIVQSGENRIISYY